MMKLFKRTEPLRVIAETRTQRTPRPSPLVQAMVRGHIDGMRSQLQKEGKRGDLPLASQIEARIEHDCASFYLQCAGQLLRNNRQAYFAGYALFRARNGEGETFSRDQWPRIDADALQAAAENFQAFQAVEGEDGLIYQA